MSSIAQKIDMLEHGQKDIVQNVDKIKTQVVQLESRLNKHDSTFRKVEQDCKYFEFEMGRLGKIIEDLDNNYRRNNMRLKGLNEEVEDGNLKQYLETLLTGCLGSDTDAEVQVTYAHGVGRIGRIDLTCHCACTSWASALFKCAGQLMWSGIRGSTYLLIAVASAAHCHVTCSPESCLLHLPRELVGGVAGPCFW